MANPSLYYDVIGRPLVTEKSTILKEKSGDLVFKVHPNATKIDIRRAIEESFDVQVASVRTVKVLGKFKRQGKTSGYRANWKKAYVSLREGSKGVEYFEL
jgi:large subunit ribosomal protein L23